MHEFCLITLNNSATSLACDTSTATTSTGALFEKMQIGMLIAMANLFSETLKLLMMLGFREGLEKYLRRSPCKVAQQVLQILEDVSKELSSSMRIHKQLFLKSSDSQEISFHRIAYLTTLKCVLEFRHCVPHHSSNRHLDTDLKAAILDITLYLSHKYLHQQVCNLYSEEQQKVLSTFDEAKRIMKSMTNCIKIMKNLDSLNPTQILSSCNTALLSYPWHEHTSIISIAIRHCRKQNLELENERENKLVSDTVTKMLAHPDSRVKTCAYLELHGLVQDVLGINRSLDIDGRRKTDLNFLIECPDIMKEIIQFGCGADNGEHVRQAAEEIIMYLLKSDDVLDKVMWRSFIKNVMRNIAILNCLIGAINDGRDGDDGTPVKDKGVSSYLSKKLLSMVSPIAENMSNKSTQWLSSTECLRSNMRLMFHREESVRHRANANLKSMLSQENDSIVKLPLFSDIIQTDLSGKTKLVYNPDLRTVVDLDKDQSYLPPLLILRASTPDPENLLTLKKVLDILGEISTSAVHLQRTALSRLEIILRDPVVQERFLQKQCNGLHLLSILLRQSLSEIDDDHNPNEFLPSIIKCLSILTFHNDSIREHFYEN